MKKIKVAVCAAFLAAIGAFQLVHSDRVSGQAGATLTAPTGIDASDNQYNSKVGIYWDTIRGATLYRIFRSTTANSAIATDIGTTVSNNFFDTTAAAGTTYYYWVRAENGSNVSSLGTPDQGTRSNTANQPGLAPLGAPPVPAGNPITATKIYLGKTLFWDEQMSSTRTIACGTCHHSSSGGTDPRISNPLGSTNPGPNGIFEPAANSDDIFGSAGVPSNNADGTYVNIAAYGLDPQVTPRRSLSYVNAGYSPSLFWDGRALSTFRDPITNAIVLNNNAALESQVLGPPVSNSEMGHNGRDWNDVAARIAAAKPLALSPNVPAPMAAWLDGRTYPQLFEEAFGTPDVTPQRIAMAIATFERSLYSDRAPIDLESQGIGTLTASESRGRNIFNSPANNCSVCHGGNRLTDDTFHYIGVRPDTDDTGREQVTGFPANRGEMRTPSLRNLELRGSYFHNGRFTTIEQVVDFYDRGGDFDGNVKPNLIHPLGLNQQQKADLAAFLKRPLTDPRVAAETERFARPALYGESSRVPLLTGSGRAGAGAVTPQMRALSPPLAGNPNFTVSVSGALGNAPATLVISLNDPGTPSAIPTSGDLAFVTTATQNTGAGNGWASVSIPIPATANVIGQTYYARWYVQDAAAQNGFSATQAAKFTVFGDATTAPARAKYVDFDGDGKTDISVFRPNEGVWYEYRSSDNVVTAKQFGIASDVLAPADYDGDGKTDEAVFRDGSWFIQRSRDGFAAIGFGMTGDIPQPGDYDGDGIADVAVFRPSNGVWYIQKSRDGFAAVQFGISTDKPLAADYDGDGKADQAVYRDGIWYIYRSSAGFYAAQFGLADDKPVFGDYDGDGKADLAVWRPSVGTWYILRSSDQSVTGGGFGISGDLPAPGDYNGNGKNDLAVFRPSGGSWYILDPQTGAFRATQFGASGDKPVPSVIVP